MSDNIIPESNKIGDKVIDRIYGDIHGGLKLILKNGTKYEGKIERKSIKREDGTVGYVHYANGKWFDRCGLPIEKPKNLLSKSI